MQFPFHGGLPECIAPDWLERKPVQCFLEGGSILAKPQHRMGARYGLAEICPIASTSTGNSRSLTEGGTAGTG